MFITNGDEIINLNQVRMFRFFEGSNFIIRLEIDDNQFVLFRFEEKFDYLEAKDEMIELLTNINHSWVEAGRDIFIRADKLQCAKCAGSEMKVFMDTGCFHISQKDIYKNFLDLVSNVRAIHFGD